MEEYKTYRKYLRDFPETHDPEIDENGEAVEFFNLPETGCWFRASVVVIKFNKITTLRCLDPRSRI